MREIIQGKLSKIFVTFITLVITFLGITFVGYIVETELLNDMSYSYLDYLLYLLGYGSIDESNIWFKVVFSISSLFVLTLFSSACTVTWLESRRTLKVDDKIVISSDNNKNLTASIRLHSKAQSIYDAKVNAIINVGRESFGESVDIAYIPNRNYRYATFDISLNSVFYKHIKEVLDGHHNGTELIISVTYSDVLSGEEYTVFKKYNYDSCLGNSDFVFCKALEDYISKNHNHNDIIKSDLEGFVLSEFVDINTDNAQIIDSRSPERYKPQLQNKFSVEFIKEKSYNDGDFQMLCIPIDVDEDWGVYYDMGAHLSIKIDDMNDIDVFIEIKNDDGRSVILAENNKLSKDNKCLDVDMRKYRRHTWENIKEVCFTVFHSHVRDEKKKAEFTIKECGFKL